MVKWHQEGASLKVMQVTAEEVDQMPAHRSIGEAVLVCQQGSAVPAMAGREYQAVAVAVLLFQQAWHIACQHRGGGCNGKSLRIEFENQKNMKELEKTIGEIVSADYRTARVFEKHKIDFCCKGNRTLREVCEIRKVDQNVLLKELECAREGTPSHSTDFDSWPIVAVASYVERVHHKYVEDNVPLIKQYLSKLCQVHGARHPELFRINEEFHLSSGELATHMKKEELMLFPYIRKIASTQTKNSKLDAHPLFETIANPITAMMEEHAVEGGRFEKISQLTNGYVPPADACNTYRVTYAMLEEFEQDLHLHIHLENNILFPKAIALEQQLQEQALTDSNANAPHSIANGSSTANQKN
ncbi:MAG: iron-sulfur cluster repair di-iron protein [Cyclobacteriaceae bacterium]